MSRLGGPYRKSCLMTTLIHCTANRLLIYFLCSIQVLLLTTPSAENFTNAANDLVWDIHWSLVHVCNLKFNIDLAWEKNSKLQSFSQLILLPHYYRFRTLLYFKEIFQLLRDLLQDPIASQRLQLSQCKVIMCYYTVHELLFNCWE